MLTLIASTSPVANVFAIMPQRTYLLQSQQSLGFFRKPRVRRGDQNMFKLDPCTGRENNNETSFLSIIKSF
jgi:hypothetical protein